MKAGNVAAISFDPMARTPLTKHPPSRKRALAPPRVSLDLAYSSMDSKKNMAAWLFMRCTM